MSHMKGKIIEIYVKDGSTTGKVLVDGSYLHVPLLLLLNAKVGDEIIIDAGIALSRVQEKHTSKTKLHHA